MSVKLTAAYLFVALLSIYAWKDWFKSLCGLILMMAVIEHADMPKNIMGIQGLNPWNVLFMMIFLAWIVNRHREGLVWDMPRHINIFLLIYLAVVLVGVLRAVFDRSNIQDYPLKSLISDLWINTIKWALPGVLLFDGCRTRRRLQMVLVCLLTIYFLLAIQVVRRIPPGTILSGSSIETARSRCSDIGYSPVDLSVFLAGASWAIIASLSLVKRKTHKILILGSAGIVVLGQALTGGRAGYLAWAATGLTMCSLKWRKLLLLSPLVVILLPIVFSGAVERMFHGFGETDAAGQNMTNEYEVSSGRLLVWPHVIDKIAKSPIIGYGRLAMSRTGLYQKMTLEGYDGFGHPHNMYLETLLDNGIIGTIPIFIFWGVIVISSAKLFRSDNDLCSAVGGVALALTLAQVFAGIGSQHVYPEETTLGMWAAIFLMLRVHVESRRAQMGMCTVDSSGHNHVNESQAVTLSACAWSAAES